MPFSAFVEIYCREQQPRLKESTWQTKENIIQQKILPYFKDRKINEITTKDVRVWQNEMLAYRNEENKPYSSSYLKTLHNQLSAIFNYAVRFYACRFYEEAFHFAEKLYGKDNIVSAVMHADELNTAMTEKYGRPIYHYHLHIMALPVVDKEVRWTKRCKDPELVGKVKEVIHQVSHSKKWKSEKALDENGNPILNSKGKQVYHASYSILQDKFYEHMQEAGFNGFSRGERGSTAENLASLEFKIKKDKEKLSHLQEKIAGEQVRYEENHNAFMTFNEIDNSGKKSFTGKYTVSADDYEKLTTLAKQSYSAVSEAKKLQEENRYLTRQIWSLQSEVSRLKTALSELTEKCRPYLEALKAAPKAVKEFIDGILERFKKQEKSILYEPIPAPKIQSQEREKRFRKKDYER